MRSKTLTAGSNVTITSNASSITIAATPGSGARGAQWFSRNLTTNMTNISAISGMLVGDSVVNTGAGTPTILGVANVAIGGIVRATSATAGVLDGNIRGVAGGSVQPMRSGSFTASSTGTATITFGMPPSAIQTSNPVSLMIIDSQGFGATYVRTGLGFVTCNAVSSRTTIPQLSGGIESGQGTANVTGARVSGVYSWIAWYGNTP
jgi:hypothetical protein